MNILAIDPGPEESAVLCLSGEIVMWAEKIRSELVHDAIRGAAGDPYCVACEHLQCFGMAVGKEIFETAYWIGEYRAVANFYKLPFHRVYRKEVKMAICHSMRATDSNIRQAILDQYGGKEAAIGRKKSPGPLYGISGDLWSALAVALTFRNRGAS